MMFASMTDLQVNQLSIQFHLSKKQIGINPRSGKGDCKSSEYCTPKIGKIRAKQCEEKKDALCASFFFVLNPLHEIDDF